MSTPTKVPATTPRFATIAALSYRDFRFLWLGVIVFMAGLQMQSVARGYLVYDITSSPVLLGLVNTGYALPMLVFTLFGGVLADRFPKKRIIQICQAIGGATAIFVGISISIGTVTWIHILFSSLINGFIFAFIVPARTAIIPSLVANAHSSNAFALNAAAMSSTTLLAPALAGNLYNIIGADGVYFCIAGLELGAVIFTGLISANDTPSGKSNRRPIFAEIKTGFAYIRRNRLIIVLIVISMVTSLLAMPFRSLLPIYIVDVFGRGPETLGLLVSVMGIGALLGSFLVASMGRRKRGLVLILGGMISGASMVVAGFVPIIGVVSVTLFFLGAGDAFRRSLSMALIMESTDIEYQGRVSSVYAMNFGLMPLGTLPAGLVTEYFGVRAATGLLGFILLGICIFIVIKRKDLRRLP